MYLLRWRSWTSRVSRPLLQHLNGNERLSSSVACNYWLYVQSCTRGTLPGCVKIGAKGVFCLPNAGRRTQFCTSYSHNLGRLFNKCNPVHLFPITITVEMTDMDVVHVVSFIFEVQFRLPQFIYSVTHQLVGWDFSENTPGVASFALAVGSSAGWLGHEASSKSKHTKALPTTCWVTGYTHYGL